MCVYEGVTSLPFLGNYERLTERPTDQPTNEQTDMDGSLGGFTFNNLIRVPTTSILRLFDYYKCNFRMNGFVG